MLYPQPVRDRLDRLVRQTKADSMTEVIRRSLAEAQAKDEKILLRPSNPDEPDRRAPPGLKPASETPP